MSKIAVCADAHVLFSRLRSDLDCFLFSRQIHNSRRPIISYYYLYHFYNLYVYAFNNLVNTQEKVHVQLLNGLSGISIVQLDFRHKAARYVLLISGKLFTCSRSLRDGRRGLDPVSSRSFKFAIRRACRNLYT
ncbi:hypothetical protein PFISCL1PPCAC_13579 [Pristionchus fissidentatus]|uniref:G protein-coupled receptor n=1 Tax=Pristionchus fissidentatus TaxID=1538716 RepID=A0AAV5VV94_9BILA|nr:hypothetical protein PFISCL1PPCAC_13579 [Pristionchus fissidentatus]